MSSFNQDKLKNDWSKWRNELPLSSSVCSFMEPQPDLWGCIVSVLRHVQTVVSLDEPSKGFLYFCFKKMYLFAYSTMLFIEWNLRDFSPCWLQHGLNFACFSLLKARIEAFLHMLGFQVIFCLSHHCCQQSQTLPQSSLGLLFYFFLFFSFFGTFIIHLVVVMQIWISAKWCGF